MLKGLFSGKEFRNRKNGRIQKIKPKFIKADFLDEDKMCSLAWGDVSTAYYSTYIPNITVYTPFSPAVAMVWYYGLFLITYTPFLLYFVLLLMFIVPEPLEEDRKKVRVNFMGRVKNSNGEIYCGSLSTPEYGYLTTDVSLRIIEKVMSGDYDEKSGFFTPSKSKILN
jgi:short subunit dehydrogenase-like uncharacterized protein